MTILLATSQVSLRSSLTAVLQELGHAVCATPAQGALDLVKVNSYALILLDVEQPEEESFKICRRLRSLGYVHPILLLISQGSDPQAIAALEAGASDYLEKPLDFDRLRSRIQTLLGQKAGRGAGALAKKPKEQTPLCWGALSVDWEAARVTWEDQVISLTSTEYKLLELFLRNPNRIFSRSAILDRIWAAEAPTERAINTYIKEIRKKLKAAGLTGEILETVYGMGYRLNPIPEPSTLTPNFQSSSQTKIAALTQKFRDSLPDRLKVLEEAALALRGGKLNSKLWHLAQDEAHKLAGSLATFGYPQGSRLARSLEYLLRLDRSLFESEIQEFEERFTALRIALSQDPDLTSGIKKVSDRFNISQSRRLLVIDDDLALTDRLMVEGGDWGFHLDVVSNPAAARMVLNQEVPDVVLLDLSFPVAEEDGLSFLQDLREQFPALPVVVFTCRNSLHDRLTVSRLGTKGFLHKPVTISQIFQKLQQALPQTERTEAKVLIVDDDLETLSWLSTILTPWGLTVITLDDPEEFWEVLLETRPDVVLLDLEMPTVSGLELCQVVRQDAEWGNLPLLVITAHTDSLFLQQAFAAGADDFITKPVLGAELVTRVLSRIQRHL